MSFQSKPNNRNGAGARAGADRPNNRGAGARDGADRPNNRGSGARDGADRPNNRNGSGARDGAVAERPRAAAPVVPTARRPEELGAKNLPKTIYATSGSDEYITIPIDEYVKGVNSWTLSMDALNICDQFNIRNESCWNVAAKSSIAFMEALLGTTTNYIKEREMLFEYGIGVNPIYSDNIREKMGHFKWIIAANVKQNNVDDKLARFIGLVAGICLYFNARDLMASKIHSFNNGFISLCKQYTVSDF